MKFNKHTDTSLKIIVLQIWNSYELQWLDLRTRHKDSNPRTDCHARMRSCVQTVVAVHTNFDIAEIVTGSAFCDCSDVIMSPMASQITSLTIVYSTFHSGADQRKHESSASLASVLGIHRWPVNSPHKGPVTREMFPFDDVIMHTNCIVIFDKPVRSWTWNLFLC